MYLSVPHMPELDGAALVRELHVYGPLVGVGLKPQARKWQHRGYGEELLAEATERAGDYYIIFQTIRKTVEARRKK